MGGSRSRGKFNNFTADYWLKPFRSRPLRNSDFAWTLIGSNGYQKEITNLGSSKPQMFDVMNIVIQDPEPFGESKCFRVIGGKPKRVAVKFTKEELSNYQSSLKSRAHRITSTVEISRRTLDDLAID